MKLFAATFRTASWTNSDSYKT